MDWCGSLIGLKRLNIDEERVGKEKNSKGLVFDEKHAMSGGTSIW